MDSSTCMICIGLVIIICVTIVLIYRSKEESFEHVGKAAQLPDGVYTITSADGNILKSSIIDTVQCKDFTLGQPAPSKSDSWLLKRVAGGVYILYKTGKHECLYSSPANQLRSYFFPSCDSQNLCGLETPDWKGELEGDSLRTYFMILQHPEGKYYLKNMQNDMYITMEKDSLLLTKQPTKNSLFDIQSV